MRKAAVLGALLALFASQAVSDSPDKKFSEFVFARVEFNMNFKPAALPVRLGINYLFYAMTH